MLIRHAIVALLAFACSHCATTASAPQDQPSPPETSDPQSMDPLVDPEVMTDRPIESTTLEPEKPVQSGKDAKSKKKRPSKKKK